MPLRCLNITAMERVLREILLKAVGSQQGVPQSVSKTFWGITPEPVQIEIETPKEESFGDLSTPIAMGLAKTLKKPPRKIAEDIVNEIKGQDIFEKIEIAGPGFINFTFSKDFLCSELKELIEKQNDFLIEDIGKGRRVQIEFVSVYCDP